VKAEALPIEEHRTDRLDELYARHAHGTARLAFLLTGDRALAEDLTQEAFVRLAGRFGHLRDPDAAGAYLRRTVVNLANSHFRHAAVERQTAGRPAARIAADEGVDVATREAVRTALRRLPPRQRAAVVLRYYEDLSERATADLLRCRPGTVKSLLSHAMAKLRAEIEGDRDG
jgi:RNA polymerase sigma-70 factor (sigma-E family)